MEYDKAIEVLKKLAAHHPLTSEEQEAVQAAIGVLTLGSLAQAQIKAKKAKRDKSIEW